MQRIIVNDNIWGRLGTDSDNRKPKRMFVREPREQHGCLRRSGQYPDTGMKLKIAFVLVRFDHVARTDLTHFRIFPRNLALAFTQYLR